MFNVHTTRIRSIVKAWRIIRQRENHQVKLKTPGSCKCATYFNSILTSATIKGGECKTMHGSSYWSRHHLMIITCSTSDRVISFVYDDDVD